MGLRLSLEEFRRERRAGLYLFTVILIGVLVSSILMYLERGVAETYLGGERFEIPTAAMFDRIVQGSSKPVAVMFKTPQCPVCKEMYPYWLELEKASPRLPLDFYDITATEATVEVFQRYGVQEVPTFIVFVNGTPVARYVGGFEADNITAAMLAWALSAIGLQQLSPEEYVREALDVFNRKCSSCHGVLGGLDEQSIQEWFESRPLDDVLAERIREALSANTSLAGLYGGAPLLREAVAEMRRYTDLTAGEVERAAYIVDYVSSVLAGVEPPEPPLDQLPLNTTVIESGRATPVNLTATVGEHGLPLPVLGVVVGFTTGVVAAFSPCVLPLLVAQLSLLARRGSGRPLSSCTVCAAASMAGTIGIGALFLVVAAVAAVLQEVLLPILAALILASGVTSLLGVPFELRALVSTRRGGLAGFCAVYGLLAVQCNLPIVTGALLMIAGSGSASYGLATLLSFALGISLPLAIVVYVSQRMPERIRGVERYSGLLSRIGGAVLSVAGVVLLLHAYGFI